MPTFAALETELDQIAAELAAVPERDRREWNLAWKVLLRRRQRVQIEIRDWKQRYGIGLTENSGSGQKPLSQPLDYLGRVLKG